MNEAIALVTAVGVTATALSGLAAALVKLWRRDNVTDRRVDLLWEAYLRRGLAEGKRKDLISESAPDAGGDPMLAVATEVREAYQPIAPFLRQLRRKNPSLTDGQFAEEVERNFGSWLSKHICQPLGVSDGACLQMALVVASEEETKA